MLKEYTNAIMKIKYSNNEFKCKKCFKVYESYNGLKNHIISKMCKREQIDLYDKITKKYFVNTDNLVNNTDNLVNNTDNFVNTDNLVNNTDNLVNNTDNLVNNTDNLVNNINTKNKYKKKLIPHALRRSVWNYWIGEIIGLTKCLCCNITSISQMVFHCGR